MNCEGHEAALNNIKEEVRTLNKIVRDGNGQPGLVQQVGSLKTDFSRLEHEIKAELTNMDKNIKSIDNTLTQQNTKMNDTRNISWQFKAAIIVALISSFTSIGVSFIEKNKTKNENEEIITGIKKLIELQAPKTQQINGAVFEDRDYKFSQEKKLSRE